MTAGVTEAHGPKYFLNIEGLDEPKEWSRETVTVAEIKELAGWDDSQPVLEVDLETNDEVTLANDDTVTLKPGHGFAKKVKFKRG